ncbi:hypothetical protein CLOM_g9039 [Closterium sp. NIES-68]|nr:hypothetical protein CLOM_g9039 [Closterium sp. NIES-68]
MSALRPLAQALPAANFMRHRDRDVRVLLAFCISEVLRVFAPDPPYDDSPLKSVFELLVGTYEGLEDTASPLYPRRVAILESMARVKTCIIMLDLECTDLILHMFETFFRVVRPEHALHVQMAMVEVMASVIDESEDVSPHLLDAIVCNMLSPEKEASPYAYHLAAAVVKRSAERLQPVFQRHLAPAIRTVAAAAGKDGESKGGGGSGGGGGGGGGGGSLACKRYHDVILEVFRVAPSALEMALPQIHEELVHEDPEVRLKAVSLVGRLLMVDASTLQHHYRQLFAEFLRRSNDKSVDVRVKLVNLLESFLLPASTSAAAAAASAAGAGAGGVAGAGAAAGAGGNALVALYFNKGQGAGGAGAAGGGSGGGAGAVVGSRAVDMSEIRNMLLERLLDVEERVRQAAVKALCSVFARSPKLLPVADLRAVADRLRDKKVPVRRFTLPEIARVYREHCSRCAVRDREREEAEAGKGLKEDGGGVGVGVGVGGGGGGGMGNGVEGDKEEEEEVERFEWLPSRMIKCCYFKDCKDFKPQTMDVFFDDELFPKALPVERRAFHWVYLFHSFDINDLKAFSHILQNKQILQASMTTFLKTRQELKDLDARERKKAGEEAEKSKGRSKEKGADAEGEGDSGEEGGGGGGAGGGAEGGGGGLAAVEAERKVLQERMVASGRRMAQAAFLDVGKAEDHFTKLGALKDNHVFRLLSSLMSPAEPLAAIQAMRDELLKRIGERSHLYDFMKDLSYKLSFHLFGRQHTEHVLAILGAIAAKGEEAAKEAAKVDPESGEEEEKEGGEKGKKRDGKGKVKEEGEEGGGDGGEEGRDRGDKGGEVRGKRLGVAGLTLRQQQVLARRFRLFVSAAIRLLVEVAAHFPALFEGCFASLLPLLRAHHPELKEGAAKLLSKLSFSPDSSANAAALGNSSPDSQATNDTMECLKQLAIDGTRHQIKAAVAALSASIYGVRGRSTLSFIYEKAFSSLESANEQQLQRGLDAMGEIARFAPDVWQPHEDAIIKFVVRKLLRRSSASGQASAAAALDTPCPVATLKARGIKMLVKTFLPRQPAPGGSKKQSVGLQAVLGKLLPRGEVYDDVQSSEADRALLRVTAAKSVVNLSTQLDSQITADLYRLAVLTSLDPVPVVRRGFASKLIGGLKDRSVPMRYAAALPLLAAAEETDSEPQIEVRRYLAEYVDATRRAAARRSVAGGGAGEDAKDKEGKQQQQQQRVGAGEKDNKEGQAWEVKGGGGEGGGKDGGTGAAGAAGVGGAGLSTIIEHPEYALVYLAYVLAQHPQWPKGDAASAKAEDYEPVQRPMEYLLRALLQGGTEGGRGAEGGAGASRKDRGGGQEEVDNLGAVLAVLRTIKAASPVANSVAQEKLATVCDIGIAIAKAIGRTRPFTLTYSHLVPLPSALFKVPAAATPPASAGAITPAAAAPAAAAAGGGGAAAAAAGGAGGAGEAEGGSVEPSGTGASGSVDASGSIVPTGTPEPTPASELPLTPLPDGSNLPACLAELETQFVVQVKPIASPAAKAHHAARGGAKGKRPSRATRRRLDGRGEEDEEEGEEEEEEAEEVGDDEDEEEEAEEDDEEGMQVVSEEGVTAAVGGRGRKGRKEAGAAESGRKKAKVTVEETTPGRGRAAERRKGRKGGGKEEAEEEEEEEAEGEEEEEEAGEGEEEEVEEEEETAAVKGGKGAGGGRKGAKGGGKGAGAAVGAAAAASPVAPKSHKKKQPAVPAPAPAGAAEIALRKAYVGRRIKVWWPLDKAYYKGTIKSYQVKTEKHTVRYDDGDKEDLLLHREKFEFIDGLPPPSAAAAEKPATSAPDSGGKGKASGTHKKGAAEAAADGTAATVSKSHKKKVPPPVAAADSPPAAAAASTAAAASGKAEGGKAKGASTPAADKASGRGKGAAAAGGGGGGRGGSSAEKAGRGKRKAEEVVGDEGEGEGDERREEKEDGEKGGKGAKRGKGAEGKEGKEGKEGEGGERSEPGDVEMLDAEDKVEGEGGGEKVEEGEKGEKGEKGEESKKADRKGEEAGKGGESDKKSGEEEKGGEKGEEKGKEEEAGQNKGEEKEEEGGEEGEKAGKGVGKKPVKASIGIAVGAPAGVSKPPDPKSADAKAGGIESEGEDKTDAGRKGEKRGKSEGEEEGKGRNGANKKQRATGDGEGAAEEVKEQGKVESAGGKGEKAGEKAGENAGEKEGEKAGGKPKDSAVANGSPGGEEGEKGERQAEENGKAEAGGTGAAAGAGAGAGAGGRGRKVSIGIAVGAPASAAGGAADEEKKAAAGADVEAAGAGGSGGESDGKDKRQLRERRSRGKS